MSERKQGLPPLQRLLMIAESVDAHASIAARPGQMDELELLAAELREIYRELSPSSSSVDEGNTSDG